MGKLPESAAASRVQSLVAQQACLQWPFAHPESSDGMQACCYWTKGTISVYARCTADAALAECSDGMSAHCCCPQDCCVQAELDAALANVRREEEQRAALAARLEALEQQVHLVNWPSSDQTCSSCSPGSP